MPPESTDRTGRQQTSDLPRPWWAKPIACFCAGTVVFLVFRDLTLPEVRDTEVWFGFEVRGPWAIATAPLHWAIFAVGAWAYWTLRPWIWPWAAVYAATIAAGHLVWNLTSPNGHGLFAGLWQLGLFSVPAALLWLAKPPGSKVDR